jgi:ABC-2 type transport system permease protein
MIALEWKDLVRERGTWWILAALLIASVIALLHGVSHHHRQAAAIEAAHAQANASLEKARAKAAALNADPAANVPYWLDPRDVGGFAIFQLVTFATKPPLPLAVLNIGQSDLYPSYVQLNTDAKDKGVGAQEIYNPHQLLAGPFDIAFVVIFLAPLALIALSATVGARDREQGTHLLLAIATRRPWVVYARRVALRAVTVCALLAATLIAATLAGAIPGRPWIDVMLFVGLVALYLLFWAAVIAAIGFTARSAGESALRLFCVWVGMLVVVPAIANFTAQRLESVPPRAMFVQAMRDATDAINRERLSLLENYFVDHPEFAPVNQNFDSLPFTITRIVTVQELERRVAEVEAQYTSALDAQQRLLSRFEVLSPGLWLQSVMNRLSGTDLDRQRDFLRQVDAYHAALRDFFHPRILSLTKQADYRVCVDCPGATRASDHFDFPQYRYTPFRASLMGVRGAIEGLAALIAACVALLIWGQVRLRREHSQ